MYCQLKNDFTQGLFSLNLPMETISAVLEQLDVAAYGYEVSKKCTEVSVYNQELPDMAKRFLITRSVEGLSPDTLYNYRKFLEIFFQATQKIPEEIRTDDITFFLYWYKRRNPEKELSDRSMDKVLNCIKAFFKWAYQNRYIDFDYAAPIKPIRYEKKPVDPLSEEELELVRRSCVTLKEKAIIELLFSTGCRVGELVILKLSDINWNDKTVHLFGKGKKHRTGFLNIRAVFALRDYLNSREDSSEYVFVSDRRPHNQMHVDGIQKIIRNVKNRAGLERKLTPHVLRHTTATIMLDKGASLQDVQKVLGHEKIETTLVYAKVSMRSVQESHRKYVS